MAVLVPMSREAFAAFAAEANAAYAQDHVLAGNWTREEALAKAAAQMAQLLPQGIDTPGQHLYEIRDGSGTPVGHAWLGVLGAGDSRVGYVYNIGIDPAHRRKGHARSTLLALEAMAATMQLPALRLHVFAHNAGAVALYRSIGYEVTSSTMRKALRRAA